MREKEKIIITSSIFNGVTSEEFKLLEYCKKRGDWLIVGLHSDLWLYTCSGITKLDVATRRRMLSWFPMIDEIFTFNDTDGTVCHLLNLVKKCYPNSNTTYIGISDMQNKPEFKVTGIHFEHNQTITRKT